MNSKAQQLGAVDAENVGGADAGRFLAAPLTHNVVFVGYQSDISLNPER